MKKVLLVASSIILSLGWFSVAQAQDTSTTSNMNSTKGTHNKPCMRIATSCESAGYRLSKAVPGKNIWKDCVTPILAGQEISGVTADPADIKACSEHKAAWKSKHHMTPKTTGQ